MTQVVLKKVSGSLHATDLLSEGWLGKIKDGQELVVSAKKSRNPQHHRKMFALLNICVENTELFLDVEQVLAVVKIMVGHVDVLQANDGRIFKWPKSISFATMGQDEFSTFYDSVVRAICENIMPGTDPEDLTREVASRTQEETETI